MKRCTLACLLSLFYFISINAQTPDIGKKSNRIGIHFGADISYTKDLNFSPLNNTGSGYAIKMTYERKTKKDHLFFINLDYANSTLNAQASDFFKYDRYLANVEFGYLIKALKNKDRFSIHAGLSGYTHLDFLNYRDFTALTFFNFHGILASAKFNYRLHTKHHLSAKVSIPLVGVLSRPPYSGWDKFMVENENNLLKVLYRGKVASLDRFFGLHFHFDYSYALSDRWDFNFQYQLWSYRTQEQDLAIIGSNQTFIGLNFKF